MAWIAIKEQRYDDAKEFINKADKATNDEWDTKLKDSAITGGWVNVFEDDWKKAVKSFKTGISRDKECFYCMDGLARFYIAEAAKFLKDKKEKKAKAQYKKSSKRSVEGS